MVSTRRGRRPPTPSPFPTPRPRVPLWLLILTLLLLGVNVFLQRPSTLSQSDLRNLETGELVLPPGMSPLVAIAKVVVAFHDRPFMGTDFSGQMMTSLDQQAAENGFAQDRFRAALLVGALGDETSMRSRFDALTPDLAPDSVLRKDIATALDPDLATDAARAALEERHGWFGRAFFDDGSPNGPLAKAARDGKRLLIVGGTAALVFGALLLLGIIALIAILLMLNTGCLARWPTAWREDHSIPGVADPRRLWMETVAVFLAGFLGFKLLMSAVGLALPGVDLTWAHLLGQWLLLPLVFWPRFRGMSRDQHRGEIGWHRGRGVAREIGAGVVGYVAMVPIYFVMTLLVLLFMFIYSALSGQKQAPIDNRVLDMASGGTLEVIMVFLLATVWAPIVEEAVFRGALFRYLRARRGLAIAAIASAAVFAALHGYMVPQLLLVGTLGAWFALMREWRGSLLPSMTAHCLHNALVFSFTVALAPTMQG